MYSASHNSVCLEFHILTVLYAGGSSVNLQREIDSVKSGILKAADGTETFYVACLDHCTRHPWYPRQKTRLVLAQNSGSSLGSTAAVD